jgi:hypothetical protein
LFIAEKQKRPPKKKNPAMAAGKYQVLRFTQFDFEEEEEAPLTPQKRASSRAPTTPETMGEPDTPTTKEMPRCPPTPIRLPHCACVRVLF